MTISVALDMLAIPRIKPYLSPKEYGIEGWSANGQGAFHEGSEGEGNLVLEWWKGQCSGPLQDARGP
jgi:hypothetical protein